MKAYRSEELKKILADPIGYRNLLEWLYNTNQKPGIIKMSDGTKYTVKTIPIN